MTAAIWLNDLGDPLAQMGWEGRLPYSDMHVKCCQQDGLLRPKERRPAMKKGSTEGKFVGIDISDKQGTFILLAEDGRVVEEGKVAMTPASLEHCFGERESCRIALETGTHSPWAGRTLAAL